MFGNHKFKHLKGEEIGEEFLKPLKLEKGINLADLGSGPGRFAIPIARIIYPGKVYAIDIDKEFLDYIEKIKKERNIDNIITIQADITNKVPLEDKSIDFVLLANVFHDIVHEKKEEGLLKEIKRILKDNGKIGVVEFKKEYTEFGPPISIRLSPEETISFFEKYGFKLLEGPTYLSNHYILIFCP
ncbi:2-methoxy-6-polyprenyl-1,4-benzoquinol methylase, mitochondrial [Nanoarchaeota archaeon]